jgi:hypothetical protein
MIFLSRTIVIKHVNTNQSVNVDEFPHQCGLCHKNVEPIFLNGSTTNDLFTTMQAVFQCTNLECKNLIIGYYSRESQTKPFIKQKIAPINPIEKNFNVEIKDVSPNFVEIYNQALFAEQTGLTLISGIGFRKALEFLVKDFLVYLNQEEEEAILNMPLGQCINKLDNSRIKEIAKRATWIGNDEAHYTRKWFDKDVSDLKKLIEVTVYFISMDISAEQYLEQMV